jgi:hypothetical protein
MDTQLDVQKIFRFLQTSPGAFPNEVAAGTGLPVSTVQTVLNILVAESEVRRLDAKDGFDSQARYTLVGYAPPAPDAPIVDSRSIEQKWSDEAATRERAKQEALTPKVTPRYNPTAEAVQAELDAAEARRQAAFNMTPEQRAQLKLMEGRTPRNPQAFVKR